MKRILYSLFSFHFSLFTLLLACCAQAMAQSDKGVVEGRVVDVATGQGIVGVTVSSGTAQVFTDSLGHYRLPGLTGVAALAFDGEGYISRTMLVPVTSDSVHANIVYLSGVVFSPIAAQRNAYTNTASLSVDDAVSDYLAHDVRAVRRSGQYGIGNQMFIRGLNSLNATAHPLIVLDGVVVDEFPGETSIHEGFYINRLLDIDPQDIDRVEVIKDATALYGSKGANGVILIYTKRGLTDQTRITLNASLSTKQRPHLPQMMNGAEFRRYVSEIYQGSDNGNAAAGGFDGIFNENTADRTYNANHGATDWNDEVYHTGLLQRYSLGIQGGDDVARYNVSVGYLTGNEVVRNVDFSRINTRVNADINLTKWFDLGAEVYFTRVERELRDDGTDAFTSPTYTARIKSPFFNPFSFTDDGSTLTRTLANVDALGVTNPRALIENAKGEHKQYRFSINATPTFHIGRDWTVRGQFSYYHDKTGEHYFSPMMGVTPQKLEGLGTSRNTVKEQDIRQSSIYADVNLGYHHLFADAHDLRLSLGQRVFANSYKSTYGEGHNTGDDQIYNLSTNLDFLQTGGNDVHWNSTSLYLQANYTLHNKYSLWAVAAADASSRFGAKASGSLAALGTRWALFPSAGISWDAKGERFLNNASWIDALKVKASWGMSGNDAIDAIASWGYLSPINYAGVATGHIIGNLRNDKLKWETTTKLTAGIEMAFLHDRLSLGFDVYRHTTDDLLNYRNADRLSGKSYYLTNAGSLRNQGFEAQVNGKLIASRRFNWHMGLSLNHYKNEITDLPEGEFITEVLDGYVLSRKGEAAGVFYGYKTAGVFATTAEADAAGLKIRNADTSLSSFAAGDIHFLEPNAEAADGIIDENDRTIIGDPNPDLTGALLSRWQWRHWELDLHCSFQLGGDIYNYQRSQLEAMSSLHNQSASVLNRWRGEGQLTDVPRAAYADPLGNSRFSDCWIEDGSFFKIRQLRLAYNLPINNPFIEGFSVWAAVDNVCTFTRYLGADPECYYGNSVLTQGIDFGLMPSCRTFTFGIKLNL